MPPTSPTASSILTASPSNASKASSKQRTSNSRLENNRSSRADCSCLLSGIKGLSSSARERRPKGNGRLSLDGSLQNENYFTAGALDVVAGAAAAVFLW